jgi:hypothetical protein
MYQALSEAELTAVIGAAPHERSPERVAHRDGHRAGTLTTTAGDLELPVPKLRTGSNFWSLLERLDRHGRLQPRPNTQRLDRFATSRSAGRSRLVVLQCGKLVQVPVGDDDKFVGRRRDRGSHDPATRRDLDDRAVENDVHRSGLVWH